MGLHCKLWSGIMNNVDRIIFLMEEIAVLESRFQPEDTGHLRTAVNVLKERVEELRNEIKNG